MSENRDLTPGPQAITEVRIRLAPDATSGLVAFASCRYGGARFRARRSDQLHRRVRVMRTPRGTNCGLDAIAEFGLVR